MDTTKLIVKAPNGVEDMTLNNVELSWTIKKLKNYLSEVYPNKPSTEEQKLIYSGQLLNDAVVLKDVLRQYDGQETHTVHLVFTPKSFKNNSFNKSSTKMQSNTDAAGPSSSVPSSTGDSMETSDGLRQRNVAGQQQNQQRTNIPAIDAAQFAANYINPNMFYNMNAMYQPVISQTQQPTQSTLVAQQLAMQNWMQMAYTQYMSQYYQMMSMGGVRPETLYMPPSTTASASGGGVPPNMAYMPQTLPNPTASQPTTSPQIPTPAAQPVAAGGVAPQPQPAPVDANGAPADNPANDQQPQAVARRFPNIIQEEQESRDWLDILYAFCRLTILLTLVYFYSSPIRCLIVIFVGIAIYMYHIGMFRQQQQRQQDQQAAQAQPAVAAPNQNGDNNNNVNMAENENGNTPATGTEAQPLLDTASTASQNNRNVTALVRTFVVSFLSSLIPEAPAL